MRRKIKKNKKKLFFIILILILLSTSIIYIKYLRYDYINGCEYELRSSGREYVICCKHNDKLYLCNDKRNFKPQEWVNVVVNLRITNKEISPYYGCGVSEINKEKDRPTFSLFSCSFQQLNKGEYHTININGYVPKEKGEFLLVKGLVYPDILFIRSMSHMVMVYVEL